MANAMFSCIAKSRMDIVSHSTCLGETHWTWLTGRQPERIQFRDAMIAEERKAMFSGRSRRKYRP